MYLILYLIPNFYSHVQQYVLVINYAPLQRYPLKAEDKRTWKHERERRILLKKSHYTFKINYFLTVFSSFNLPKISALSPFLNSFVIFNFLTKLKTNS